ncbi:ABC transporter ATP-binding protein [Glycomyces artemisiae]|uniref:ABC-2 type transport system ATP-binding protein n=1 Tax=Glycomyces artemisiae TaxID=1076443 RepID=A0A2T0UL20_9ACTN|nr:ATP-binding cassette domain-containing protein [Glycomyces artemisiae]PRY58632.1 ABC-2 type transport system ATP-binding protein [Glycomyces artemisiae]
MALIEVDGLVKHYRVRKPGRSVRRLFTRHSELKEAVRGIDLRVDAGEVVGYLGPNGAGKSTTIKCLCGIMAPDAGRIRVAGLDPSRRRLELARRIGVVFGQKTALWWDLPVTESFELLRAIYDVPRERHRRRLDELTALLGLDEFAHVPVRQLSLGQRVRSDLAAALLHDPQVLFLDEPTIGLDAAAKSGVRRFVREIRARGVAVLLTTHDLGDIEELCDRIVILDRGSVLFEGSVDEALGRYAPHSRVIVEFSRDVQGTIEVPFADSLHRRDDRQAEIVFKRAEETAAAVTRHLLDAYPVRDLRITEPSIEDVVKSLYEELGDRAGGAEPARG